MTGAEFVSIQETARRVGCSVRHLHRVLAVNDDKKTGRVRIGRRAVRIDWTRFEAAMRAGTLQS